VVGGWLRWSRSRAYGASTGPSVGASIGASTVEWGGMLLVLAAIVGVLVSSNLPADISSSYQAALCRVSQDNCAPAGGDQGGGQNPGGDQGGQNGGDPGAGNPNVGNQNVDQQYERAKQEANAADQEARDAEREAGNIDQELLNLLADIIGITDAKKCLTEGDIGACIWTAVGFVGFGKAAKIIKTIPKAVKLFNKLRKTWERVDAARKRRKAAQEALERARQTCRRGNSFAPGTLVLLADGSRVPIEDIGVGRHVLAADPVNARGGPRPVATSIVGQGRKRLVDVTIDVDGAPGGRRVTITATDEHPFWVTNARAWIDAVDLFYGDQLATVDGGPAMVVKARAYDRVQRVHNLSVTGLHTYYVMAGDRAVLVHNEDPPIDLNGKSYTVWKDGPYRIDIEARDGTKQMHFQEQINGVKSSDAPKYQYNPKTGKFDGMPKSLEKKLAKSQSYQNGLKKAKGVFGRVIGTPDVCD
jgi:hypothetical protein